MESEAVLRKLLLVAFLSVVSTGLPAYAVDYLNCREMLRTKNEFREKLINTNVENRVRCFSLWSLDKERKKYRAELNKLEMEIKDNRIEEDERFRKALELAELSIKSRRWDDYTKGLYDKCILTLEKRKVYNEKEEQHSIYYTDKEGYNWYKKVLRVKEDMRKANCPY